MTTSDAITGDSNLRRLLTPAHEDYLKTIYILSSRGNKVTNSALAKHLNVTPASATNMVKKLAELQLVVHTPYQNINLSEAGKKVALEVLRHHRLLELYLHQILNIPLEQVHAEADKLEHVISKSVEDAIADALDHPTIDPHGDPIPSRDGQIEHIAGVPLHQVKLHRPYRLVRVLNQDQERLSYLGSLGLHPNAVVTMLEQAPFDGPLLIEVDGIHHAIAHDMAESLLMVEIGRESTL